MLPNTIVLKRPGSHLRDLEQINNIEELHAIAKLYSSKSYRIAFENVISTKDKQYLLSRLHELKKKKFIKVLSECMRLLTSDPNYFWAYIVAGAACRNCDELLHDTPFHFSQAVLINPNFLTAWMCLLKYYRTDLYVDNLTFDTIFLGVLQNERNLEKWCSIVTELLGNASDSTATLRRPLMLLSTFLDHDDSDKRKFVSKAITDYLFQHWKLRNNIPDMWVGFKAIKLHYSFNSNNDTFVEKALALMLLWNDFNIFLDFLEHKFETSINDMYIYGIKYFLCIMALIPLTSLRPTNTVLQKIAKAFPKRFHMRRRRQRSYFIPMICSFGDFRRACDYFEFRKYIAMKKSWQKVWRFSFKEVISVTWSYLKLQDFERGYSLLVSATKKFLPSKKRAKWKINVIRKEKVKKKAIAPQETKKSLVRKQIKERSILNIWLYILTHGPVQAVGKLGVLFCLKLSKQDKSSVQFLFYACVGFIGLGYKDEAIILLQKLLKIGAMAEVIYLKALLGPSFSTSMELLDVIPEFSCAQKLAAAIAIDSARDSKAFKSVCKASVAVPSFVFFYEWLGHFFYKKGNLDKAEKYFEIALYYNPHSWVAIASYRTLLSRHNPEASKRFLSMYRYEKTFNSSHSVAFITGMEYLKHGSKRNDYYTAADNFMYSLRLYPQVFDRRLTKELIGESLSRFGMIGTSEKWLSDSYIHNKTRHFYAGCQLAKQRLFLKGIRQYAKVMRNIISKGGLNTFICLHNAGHAFLLKSIKAYINCRHRLSQIYCQQAMFLAARALTVNSNFGCSWKLMGDILYQCASSTETSGFIYAPDWLCPEYADDSIILLTRPVALKVAIRCYITGLDSEYCTKRLKACLWNSIAVAYSKMSLLCSFKSRKRCILLAIECCFKALKENIRDSHSWHTLGGLLKEAGYENKSELFNGISICLNTSIVLKGVPHVKSLTRANLGYICMWNGLFDAAAHSFMQCRGRDTSLDYPWIGQILLNIILGTNIKETINYFLFIFKFTRHRPKIGILFFSLLFLSQYFSEPVIRHLAKKYSKYIVNDIYSFNDNLLSFLVNKANKKPEKAKLDLIFALRTANGLYDNSVDDYNIALSQLAFLPGCESMQPALLNISQQNAHNVKLVYSLCKHYKQEGNTEMVFTEVLRGLATETNQVNQKILTLALAYICAEKGAENYAKYYFSKATEQGNN